MLRRDIQNDAELAEILMLITIGDCMEKSKSVIDAYCEIFRDNYYWHKSYN